MSDKQRILMRAAIRPIVDYDREALKQILEALQCAWKLPKPWTGSGITYQQWEETCAKIDAAENILKGWITEIRITVDRCAWCGCRHEGGPENCPPDETDQCPHGVTWDEECEACGGQRTQ